MITSAPSTRSVRASPDLEAAFEAGLVEAQSQRVVFRTRAWAMYDVIAQQVSEADKIRWAERLAESIAKARGVTSAVYKVYRHRARLLVQHEAALSGFDRASADPLSAAFRIHEVKKSAIQPAARAAQRIASPRLGS